MASAVSAASAIRDNLPEFLHDAEGVGQKGENAGSTSSASLSDRMDASIDEGESVPLTKSDLIAAVAAHTSSTAKDVATVLTGLEDVVIAKVAKGEKIVLTGFLTFDRVQRAARTGRNPGTGEAIKIKASKNPKVSAGATFKKIVNGQAPAPKLTKAK
jgi:DNA-binding protein HU-beta